jgi:outer membrane immunogenic protein
VKNSLYAAIAAIGVIAGSQSAVAADMPRKAAPPPIIESNWGGFYLGGNVGYGWASDATFTVTDPLGAGAFAPFSGSMSGGDGIVGGVHGGYNWQINPSWLVGVEADYSWTDIGLSVTGPIIAVGGAVVPTGVTFASMAVKNIASVRGRVGYTTPTWMTYLTGGVAWADVDYHGQFSCAGPCAPPAISQATFNDTVTGWVLGAGAEFKMAPASPWIVGLEYLFYSLDTAANASGRLNLVAGGCVPVGVPCNPMTWADTDIQILRARLGYKF